MQFTPQQMAGYKGYSPGVLIGNWSEDLQVMEDKMKLYLTQREGTMSNANNAFALQSIMSQPIPIGAAVAGGFLPFDVPLQILSVEGNATLSLDISPKFSPKLNHVLAAFTPPTTASNGRSKSSPPVARNVFVLQRVLDENNDFYVNVKEQDMVHYGQRIRVVNEYVGSNAGFYSLVSSLQDTARSSGRQALSACLGGGNGTVFIIEPCGAPRGSKDGRPVLATDPVVLVHRNTNAAVACELQHRCTSSFGGELEASCGMVKTQQTRAQAQVATQPANFVTFSLLPPGTPYKVVPPPVLGSALNRVKAKILERGGRLGFRALIHLLRKMDKSGDSKLSRAEFRDALEVFGVPLSSADLDAVFKVFDRNGDGTVTITEFLRTMRGELNDKRRGLVDEAFKRLSQNSTKDVVSLEELVRIFRTNASTHPDATSAGIPAEQLVAEFIQGFGGDKGSVTKAQFIDYYSDMSVLIDRDDYFELMIRNAWHMSGGEGWAENTTARRVLVNFEDGTQRVVELRDDLGLRGDDLAGIMQKLASQGITDVKSVELYH